MKWFNYIVSLIFFVVAAVNFAVPFVENYSDEYLYYEDEQSYDDLFYPQNCHRDGFYWLGNLTKTEYKSEGYVPFYSDEMNNEFIALIEDATYTSLSPVQTYLVKLSSGESNELFNFVGNVSVSVEDSPTYDKEQYEKILNFNKHNVITYGTFLRVFDSVYLYAYVGDISNGFRNFALFKVDDATADKILSSDKLESDGGLDFLDSFSFEWFFKVMIPLVLYFILRPLKNDRIKIRHYISDVVRAPKTLKNLAKTLDF